MEGTDFNHLILKEFQWDNEWVEMMSTDKVHLFWSQVDEAIGASWSLEGHNLPRMARAYTCRHGLTSTSMKKSKDREEETHDQGIVVA